MHRILGTPASPFVRKARAAFGEKGVESALEPLDVFNPPEGFERKSPLRRIPVLEFTQGGHPPLADSSAICAYLEALQPEPPLYPREPHARGRAVWIEEYADTVLAYQLGMGVMRPMLAARAGGERDEAKIAEALTRRLPPLFGYLEEALGEGDWYAGEAFSIADLSVAAQLSGLMLVDRLDVLDSYPALAGLLRRSLDRPAFAAAVAEAAA